MYYIIVTRYKEVFKIADNSRADYMKKRRENKKTFSVLIEKNLVENLEKKLKQQNKSKKTWLIEKISEELNK